MPRFGILLLSPLLISLLPAPLALAATIYVPDDYPTIQQAIQAAADGDRVLVRPGVYEENLSISSQVL